MWEPRACVCVCLNVCAMLLLWGLLSCMTVWSQTTWTVPEPWAPLRELMAHILGVGLRISWRLGGFWQDFRTQTRPTRGVVPPQQRVRVSRGLHAQRRKSRLKLPRSIKQANISSVRDPHTGFTCCRNLDFLVSLVCYSKPTTVLCSLRMTAWHSHTSACGLSSQFTARQKPPGAEAER